MHERGVLDLLGAIYMQAIAWDVEVVYRTLERHYGLWESIRILPGLRPLIEQKVYAAVTKEAECCSLYGSRNTARTNKRRIYEEMKKCYDQRLTELYRL